MNPDGPFHEIIVPDGTPPQRIDQWLGRSIPELSRRRAAALLAAGHIHLDGHPVGRHHLIAGGHRITIHQILQPAVWTAAPAPEICLEILYEDDAVVAVSKPSGLPSVPLHPADPPTLAGALVARFPECAPLGRRNGDSGLISRLDTGTSGLLLAARSMEIFDLLMALQKDHRIEKHYLALVGGAVQLPAVIDAPLAPSGSRGHRVRVQNAGEPCITRLETVASGALTLVRATITKGFRHQIRAHLASVGAPLAGDVLYGGPRIPGLNRLFLHAEGIALPHPVSGTPLRITCPLPEELDAVLRENEMK